MDGNGLRPFVGDTSTICPSAPPSVRLSVQELRPIAFSAAVEKSTMQIGGVIPEKVKKSVDPKVVAVELGFRNLNAENLTGSGGGDSATLVLGLE